MTSSPLYFLRDLAVKPDPRNTMHLGFTNRQQKSPGVGAFDICGGEGIRTLDTLSDIHTFQACQFNHSCTPPLG